MADRTSHDSSPQDKASPPRMSDSPPMSAHECPCSKCALKSDRDPFLNGAFIDQFEQVFVPAGSASRPPNPTASASAPRPRQGFNNGSNSSSSATTSTSRENAKVEGKGKSREIEEPKPLPQGKSLVPLANPTPRAVDVHAPILQHRAMVASLLASIDTKEAAASYRQHVPQPYHGHSQLAYESPAWDIEHHDKALIEHQRVVEMLLNFLTDAQTATATPTPMRQYLRDQDTMKEVVSAVGSGGPSRPVPAPRYELQALASVHSLTYNEDVAKRSLGGLEGASIARAQATGAAPTPAQSNQERAEAAFGAPERARAAMEWRRRNREEAEAEAEAETGSGEVTPRASAATARSGGAGEAEEDQVLRELRALLLQRYRAGDKTENKAD